MRGETGTLRGEKVRDRRMGRPSRTWEREADRSDRGRLEGRQRHKRTGNMRERKRQTDRREETNI